MISLVAFYTVVLRSQTLIPGDSILVHVSDHCSASMPIAIEADGRARFGMLGRVHLGGLTVLDAERKVKTLVAQHNIDPELISLWIVRRAPRTKVPNGGG